MKYWITILFLTIGILQAAEISELKFEQRNGVQVPDQQLLINIQQRKGARYDQLLVNEDIKRLYGTGAFADVEAETRTLSDGNIELLYKLTYKPRVVSVETIGNVKYTQKDLAQEITLSADMPLNDAKLQESANKLREFYRNKGYHDALVIPKFENTGKPDEIKVIFLIDEKLRLKVDHVTFEGNQLFSSFKLKWAINNRYSPFSKFFEVGLLNREELELDKARIRELYWQHGYLDFAVKELRIVPTAEDPEFVDIHFVIEEGEPYKVGKLEIVGNTLFETPDLMAFLKLRPGETFNFNQEIASANAVNALYEELGYADISTQAQRSADYENHVVDVRFVITEGTKYSIRDIVISGNNVTKDKVIRRELAIQPGDPVDRNRIDASQSRLMGMGYFSKVDTAITNADAIDQKDIKINVEEKDMFNFKIGAGFSDVNSLMGMLELSNNNFDLLDPMNWFSGGGQRLRLQGIIGIERAGFNLDFSEPWLFDLPLRLDVNGYMNQSNFEYWKEDRSGGRASLTRKIFDDFTSISLAYKFEAVRVKDMYHKVSQELKDSVGTQLVSQVSVMLDRDTRDSILNPTSGYNLNALAALSPKALGSTNDFYRIEGKGSVYYPLFDKAIILMAGGRIGTVGTFNSDEEAPLFERYFMGGGDSLRGFDFRTVSPLDPNGYPMGGQSMLLVTTEISHPIWDFIRGAVFMDVGNVWSNSWEMGSINMGIGYGLRMIVPYLNAPIRLDLAYPVINNQPNVDSKLRFHFNMGFTF